jgi:hypothetical protein
MTDDDWQPLPPEQVVAHPGEFEGLAKRFDAPPTSIAPNVPAASAPTGTAVETRREFPERLPIKPRIEEKLPPPPANPEADRALDALRAKIAAAKPAQSIIASAQHREQKAERQQQAAAAPELAATVATIAATPPPAPAVEYAEGKDGRDPREDAEWFQALPPHERERLAGVWRAERERFAKEPDRRRRSLERAALDGAIVFFVVGVLAAFLTGAWATIAKMTIGGAIGALLAQMVGGGRFRYAMAGAAVFLCVLGGSVLGKPFLLYLLLGATYAMGAVGMDREMRRSGGFRED